MCIQHTVDIMSGLAIPSMADYASLFQLFLGVFSPMMASLTHLMDLLFFCFRVTINAPDGHVSPENLG